MTVLSCQQLYRNGGLPFNGIEFLAVLQLETNGA